MQRPCNNKCMVEEDLFNVEGQVVGAVEIPTTTAATVPTTVTVEATINKATKGVMAIAIAMVIEEPEEEEARGAGDSPPLSTTKSSLTNLLRPLKS